MSCPVLGKEPRAFNQKPHLAIKHLHVHAYMPLHRVVVCQERAFPGILGEEPMNLQKHQGWSAFNSLGHLGNKAHKMLSWWLYGKKAGPEQTGEWAAPPHTTTEPLVGCWQRPYANQGLRFLIIRRQLWHLFTGARGRWSLTLTFVVTSTNSALPLNLSLDHHSS